jgi:PAS domain S-box-containing protein
MPEHELKLLQTIHRFLNLEIDKDIELQEITELAAEVLDCPVALITLSDSDKQNYCYSVGKEINTSAIRNSLCLDLNIEVPEIINDTLEDHRFSSNPLVVGEPHIRFYAEAPLLTHDGHKLGNICVVDTKPKQLNSAQTHSLKVLAKRIIQITEFEFSINLLKEQFMKSRAAEIKLRAFFETSSSLHLLVDNNMNVLDFNRNMADFLWHMHDVKIQQEMPVSSVFDGESFDRFKQDFIRATKGQIVHFERKVKYRNSREIWWQVSFEPGLNPEGEIIGISYHASDITDRKNNEALILEQNRALKEIAFVQSHELRKPVATILGLVALLKQPESNEMSDELEMLDQTAKELDTKIRAIVDKISPFN